MSNQNTCVSPSHCLLGPSEQRPLHSGATPQDMLIACRTTPQQQEQQQQQQEQQQQQQEQQQQARPPGWNRDFWVAVTRNWREENVVETANTVKARTPFRKTVPQGCGLKNLKMTRDGEAHGRGVLPQWLHLCCDPGREIRRNGVTERREVKAEQLGWREEREERRRFKRGALDQVQVNAFGFNPVCLQLALGLVYFFHKLSSSFFPPLCASVNPP
ncbi:uncharacterized protein LOC125012956 isoform X1 [Mugil cephalus]|uniref:uncharacterized protein LOC125012956 isoform X1 n=1 Tax=Mugil cephalus TaxID=48193 RepID=UPI001FB745CE|nr:uncharacterized protein LOC125012956 isoform X1 [Mugil cephalus]